MKIREWKYNLPVILLESALEYEEGDVYIFFTPNKDKLQAARDAVLVLKDEDCDIKNNFDPIILALKRMRRQKVYWAPTDIPEVEQKKVKKILDGEIRYAIKLLKERCI